MDNEFKKKVEKLLRRAWPLPLPTSKEKAAFGMVMLEKLERCRDSLIKLFEDENDLQEIRLASAEARVKLFYEQKEKLKEKVVQLELKLKKFTD